MRRAGRPAATFADHPNITRTGIRHRTSKKKTGEALRSNRTTASQTPPSQYTHGNVPLMLLRHVPGRGSLGRGKETGTRSRKDRSRQDRGLAEAYGTRKMRSKKRPSSQLPPKKKGQRCAQRVQGGGSAHSGAKTQAPGHTAKARRWKSCKGTSSSYGRRGHTRARTPKSWETVARPTPRAAPLAGGRAIICDRPRKSERSSNMICAQKREILIVRVRTASARDTITCVKIQYDYERTNERPSRGLSILEIAMRPGLPLPRQFSGQPHTRCRGQSKDSSAAALSRAECRLRKTRGAPLT